MKKTYAGPAFASCSENGSMISAPPVLVNAYVRSDINYTWELWASDAQRVQFQWELVPEGADYGVSAGERGLTAATFRKMTGHGDRIPLHQKLVFCARRQVNGRWGEWWEDC